MCLESSPSSNAFLDWFLFFEKKVRRRYQKKNRHYGGKEDLAEGRKAGESVGPLLKDTKESYNRTCGIDRMSKPMVHAACDSHRKAETRCGRNED